MRRLLLDTHAFLWWLGSNPKLTKPAREAIADPTTLVHVSAVTIWEITIKAQLDRLDPGLIVSIKRYRRTALSNCQSPPIMGW